jgi:magnesium-transporting ATPase (P-type)
LAALAGLAFVVLYLAAFALGIEVGESDREILDYYADSGNRAKEVVAFFLIAAAALAFVVFAGALRSRIARAEQETAMLAALTWAGGTACAVLVLAGNAVSRATAFAAMDDEFQLDPNTRKLFENAGYLLFVTAALAAILLVVAVSIAALRHGVLPRWLGWAGFPAAALLTLAIALVGFLVLAVWVLAVSAALAFGRPAATAVGTGATRLTSETEATARAAEFHIKPLVG